jgi:hypothetical protein
MSTENKKQVNVHKDQITLDSDGKLVISDPNVIEALKKSRETAEEGWFSINFGCVVMSQ